MSKTFHASLVSAVWGVLWGLFAWGWSTRCAAQTIVDNNYAIDLFTGPVQGSGRIVGMAGAYSAIATGIDGALLNPAGYAERAEEEVDFWEWELTSGISLGGLFRNNDFDNNGKSQLGQVNAVSVSLGGRLQLARFGLGVTFIVQQYQLHDEATQRDTWVTFTTSRLGGAYAFRGGDLVIGSALRGLTFELEGTGEDSVGISFAGLGVEIGGLYRPRYERYRCSVVFRSAIDSRPDATMESMSASGVRRADGFVLPARVQAPWETVLGFAYQFGEHPSNVPWENPRVLRRKVAARLHDGSYEPPDLHGGPPYPEVPREDPTRALRVAYENEREAQRRSLKAQPRRYVLLSTDLIISGATEDGQSVEAFLLQRGEPSGRKPSYGVRAGLESEFIANRLRLRGGSYLEPSRTHRSYYRPHATFGGDVRMFDVWNYSIRATFTSDLAPRYFDWGVSVGLWY